MIKVIMIVTWTCIRCHPMQVHLSSASMTKARCVHITKELIAESWREAHEGFPTWTPTFAVCMVKP